MRVLSLVTILFTLLLFAEVAEACRCVASMSGNPPCQSFWSAPVVFSGRVTGIDQIDVKIGEMGGFKQRLVRFSVSADHRGGVGPTVEVVTGQGGGDCGYAFVTNQNYLVYAYKLEDGTLSTGICSPTKPLEKANDDLQYIRTLASAKPVGSLFGGIWEYKARRSSDEWRANPPMSGISLTLEGKAGRYAVATDNDGKYRIADIVPGEYLLRPTVPEGFSPEMDTKVTIREKGCSVMDFTLSRETSLSGRIVDTRGEPVTKLVVNLVPIEEIDQQYQKDGQFAELDENGWFTFRGVPPGSYYLGIGLGRFSVVNHAFPKTFYPGTQNRDNAAVVIVTEGQIQKGLDFQLPPKLAERKITGRVVFPDGKPVAKAHLMVIEGEHNGPRNETGSAESGEDGRFSLSLLEGLSYRVRAYINLPNGEQRHAEFVPVPAKGKVTDLKIVITEPRGSCAKCIQN